MATPRGGFPAREIAPTQWCGAVFDSTINPSGEKEKSMRYAKILGLAAIAAMVSMAFIGASSASADTLCRVNVGHTNECPAGSRLPVGELIHLESIGKVELLSSIGNVKCNSFGLGKIVATGNHQPVLDLLETLNFTACEGACNAFKAHSAPFHLEKQANGLNVYAQPHPNSQLLPGVLLENCAPFGINCLYQVLSHLADLGEIESGATGDVLKFLVPLLRSGHSAFCSEKAEWHARYLVRTDLPGDLVPVYLALLP